MSRRYPRWADRDTEYRIGRSGTTEDVDGYRLGEPNCLVCCECGASVELTEEPTPGIAGEETIEHRDDCANVER